MCIACWMTKSTDTHSEYVILIAFPQQMLCECASMLPLYVHCLSCYYCGGLMALTLAVVLQGELRPLVVYDQ
jgi:hypothetical protein